MNAKTGGHEGGICGDISVFISKAAEAVGFDNVGIMSTLWQRDGLNKPGLGHAVAYFRNPKTGEYYIQNYSTIFNTHQKAAKSAVEISTRALGVMTGASSVQSPNGVVHVYVPQTSQWVKSQIEGMAQADPMQSNVVVKIGNNEQFIGVRVARQIDGANRHGAFAFRNQVDTNAGKYSLDAVGYASQGHFNAKLTNSIIDEVTNISNVYMGYQNISGPVLSLDGKSKQGSQKGFFMGGQRLASVKINSTTGKLEVNSRIMAHNFRFIEAKSGLNQDLSKQLNNLPVKIEAERVWNFTPKAETIANTPRLKTVYDRIGVVYDPIAVKDKYYLKMGADLLLLEGADKMSAQAVRTFIKANIPTEKLGEFSVYVDASKVIKNPEKDPFYESGTTVSMKTEWKKKLDSFKIGHEKSEIGAFIGVTKGNPIQPFGVIGGTVNTPQFQSTEATTKRILLYFSQPM